MRGGERTTLHLGVDDKLRDYLKHEWAAKQRKSGGEGGGGDSEGGGGGGEGDRMFGFRDFPHARCDVPEQKNYHDCGLFVIRFGTSTASTHSHSCVRVYSVCST